MFKGQLQRSDKFIPNERSCSAENGFEVVFSKFGFVSEIQALKVQKKAPPTIFRERTG